MAPTAQRCVLHTVCIDLACLQEQQQAPSPRSDSGGSPQQQQQTFHPSHELQRSSYDLGSSSRSTSRGSSPTDGYRAPPRAVIHALAGYDVCDSAGSSDISRITPLRVQVRAAGRQPFCIPNADKNFVVRAVLAMTTASSSSRTGTAACQPVLLRQAVLPQAPQQQHFHTIHFSPAHLLLLLHPVPPLCPLPELNATQGIDEIEIDFEKRPPTKSRFTPTGLTRKGDKQGTRGAAAAAAAAAAGGSVSPVSRRSLAARCAAAVVAAASSLLLRKVGTESTRRL
jgi:hypothetical protein